MEARDVPTTRHPRLELTWPGKDQYLLAPADADAKPVWVEPSHRATHEVRTAEFTRSHGYVDDTDQYADSPLLTGGSIDALRIFTYVTK